MSALRKVLVIDDDPIVAKSFDRVLSSDKGYIVITASNGREALDKLRDEAFDVVYTDIKMPGMDGLEVAERVKARQPWTPVVIITGYGTVANEARAAAAGVSAFLHKPLSPDMIEGSLAQALRDAPAAPVSAAAPLAALLSPSAPAPAAAAAAPDSKLKNIALFLVAPVIGLAYAVLFPFIALGMLAWHAGAALAAVPAVARWLRPFKKAAAFAAAPFIGLAFVLLLPFIGLGTLLWVGLGRRVAPVAAPSQSAETLPD